MNRFFAVSVLFAGALSVSPAFALTPGLYEYVIKMNMPGVPDAGARTIQRCLSPSDVEGNRAIEIPPMANSDCKINDQKMTGAQFSYRIACTKPQKLDGDVKGTVSATSLNMDMTMRMPAMAGAVTQNIAARRVGDCK